MDGRQSMEVDDNRSQTCNPLQDHNLGSVRITQILKVQQCVGENGRHGKV